jgi:hypothetical protein
MFTVEMFFHLAIASDLIGTDRASNRVDIAYLYYLPFCMVFTSGDKIHARTAPLFMRPDQVFVRAPDLKADLAALATHYGALPEEVRAPGAMTYAAYPPLEGDYLTCRLQRPAAPPSESWRSPPTRAACRF